MIKSKSKKYTYLALAIIAALIIGFQIMKSKQNILVSATEWECKNQNCTIRFKLENKSSENLPVKIIIRAHRNEYVHGSDAMLSKIVGEKIIEYQLYPNQIKDFVEPLKILSKNVNLITVNALEISTRS